MITISMSRVVKGGRHGRPAGTGAERRPLTARVTSNWTMNVAPPLGGAWRHPPLPSGAQKILFSVIESGESSVIVTNGGSQRRDHGRECATRDEVPAGVISGW